MGSNGDRCIFVSFCGSSLVVNGSAYTTVITLYLFVAHYINFLIKWLAGRIQWPCVHENHSVVCRLLVWKIDSSTCVHPAIMLCHSSSMASCNSAFVVCNSTELSMSLKTLLHPKLELPTIVPLGRASSAVPDVYQNPLPWNVHPGRLYSNIHTSLSQRAVSPFSVPSLRRYELKAAMNLDCSIEYPNGIAPGAPRAL